METIIAIAGFGAVGCVSRYLLAGFVNRIAGPSFPFGTFAVNVIGAFVIGFIMEWSLRTTSLSPTLRFGLTTGFLGGFTTFSTFSYETFRLLEDGEFLVAGANAGLSVVACLAATYAGITIARAV